jgi:hypothetical protein
VEGISNELKGMKIKTDVLNDSIASISNSITDLNNKYKLILDQNKDSHTFLQQLLILSRHTVNTQATIQQSVLLNQANQQAGLVGTPQVSGAIFSQQTAQTPHQIISGAPSTPQQQHINNIQMSQNAPHQNQMINLQQLQQAVKHCLSVFFIKALAFFFSLSGTESSRSKQTIKAAIDFAFSKNLGLLPGTKTRLRNRFAIND